MVFPSSQPVRWRMTPDPFQTAMTRPDEMSWSAGLESWNGLTIASGRHSNNNSKADTFKNGRRVTWPKRKDFEVSDEKSRSRSVSDLRNSPQNTVNGSSCNHCSVFNLVLFDWLYSTANKPGECPRVSPGTFGICLEACSNDADCSGNLKCCSNGCGHTCQTPGNDWLTLYTRNRPTLIIHKTDQHRNRPLRSSTQSSSFKFQRFPT